MINELNSTKIINEFFLQKESISNSRTLLFEGDCLEKMPLLPAKSINLILADLPYGVSQNKWDSIIPLNLLWKEYKRLLKDNGIVVLTAIQPFTSKLILSNLKMFKYELIWEKTIGSGQLNIKHQPLRCHESILLFYSKRGTYNEQLTEGEPYKINRKIKSKGEGYGAQKDNSKINLGFRHAKTIIKIPNPRIKNGHPTQKPLELMEYIIKTYSNEDDIILDNCMGSGSTGIAALKLNRKFIGIEKDSNWFNYCNSII